MTGTTIGTSSGTSSGTGAGPDLEVAARRVDTCLERAELLDPTSRRVATDLKNAVEEFHREGLVRVVRRLKEDPRGKELLFELVDDPVVYALLVMHGIVRADPVTLAQRALEDVRPYLDSHGGGVELVSVEPPLARVRLSGSCSGCSQSATTLREVVERALVTAVPGVDAVEVVPAEPEPTVIPLGALGVRRGAGGGPSGLGWTQGPAVEDVPDGGVLRWEPDRPAADDGPTAVVLVRIGEAVSVYDDACAHQGFSLERAMVDAEGGIMTCPWHGMKYQALTGECISAVDKRLTARPARVQDGRVWVRLDG